MQKESYECIVSVLIDVAPTWKTFFRVIQLLATVIHCH